MQKRVILLLLLLIQPLFSIGNYVENYEVFLRQYQNDGTLFLVTRRFELNHHVFYVTVNSQTLQTKVLPLDETKLQPISSAFKETLFAKRLSEATAQAKQGGMNHALTPSTNHLYLTMDLCPSSKKGYESDFIQKLTQTSAQTPIAIAITSGWMDQHEKEFESLRNNPALAITWVNHTHTHFYDRTLDDQHNFMLREHTDVKGEILGLEKHLLNQGITPSVFFRFPGLMSNDALMKELRETYMLIPIGSNAWIAKNEKPKADSFILIHGNKNEPLGIEMLQKMLPELTKTYQFKPLLEAFVP